MNPTQNLAISHGTKSNARKYTNLKYKSAFGNFLKAFILRIEHKKTNCYISVVVGIDLQKKNCRDT